MKLEMGFRMKVNLNEIPEEGFIFHEKISPEELNLQTEELQFQGSVQIEAAFYGEKDSVLVRVDAGGDQQAQCDRCLTLFSRPYAHHFDLGFDTKGQFDLDITDDVRQEILLSYPVKFLCREGCLGLCPRCGKNLNEGVCSDAITEA